MHTPEALAAHAAARVSLLGKKRAANPAFAAMGPVLRPLPPVEPRELPVPEAEPEAEAEAKKSEGEAGSKHVVDAGDEPGAKPLPGYFVPIQHVSPQQPGETQKGDATTNTLAAFYTALRELQAGKRTRVRMLMYGASGTAADFATGYLRSYFQQRFGDGGPGFLPLGRITRWSRHQAVVTERSKGWRKEHAQTSKGRQDGHYGLLGVSFSSSSRRDWVRIRGRDKSASAAAVTTIELQFVRQPDGGKFAVWVDGKRRKTLATDHPEIALGTDVITLKPGNHELEIRPKGDGEVRLLGAVFETDKPGVVLDTLGIDGTRSANHLTWNVELWKQALARRAPDLIVLSYGTNEAVDDPVEIPLERYREEFAQVLQRLRSEAPSASCLVLSPVDFPEVRDGALHPRPRLHAIIEIQRELAPAHGCGFWDGLAFMGGFGSMLDWSLADPPLARTDYLHFRREGSVRKGMAVADAMMLGFDRK